MTTPSPGAAALMALVRRVRLRLKLRRSLERLVTVGGVVVALLVVICAADRLRWVGPDIWIVSSWCALAASLLAVGSGLWSRVPDGEAAWLLDRAGGLSDRLVSAVDFLARRERSAWMRAAIVDAENHLPRACPREAVPWRMPPGLGRLALGGALLMAIMASVRPVPASDGQGLHSLRVPTAPATRRIALDARDRAELDGQLVRLEEQVAHTDDGRIKGWIEQLNALLRDLDEGAISAEAVHRRIASLEASQKALKEALGADPEDQARRASRAAKKVRRPQRSLQGVLDAMRQAHWREAARAMKALSEQTSGEGSKKKRRKLGRDLEKLAKALETERERQAKKLAKERRRLARKRDKRGGKLGRRDRRRLDRTKRRLERLERERQRAGERGRTLERLQRDMADAAADLLRRQGDPGEAAEAMSRAEDMLRRLAEQDEGQRQIGQGGRRLRDIREMLRRAAKRGKGDGKGDKPGERFRMLARGEGQERGGAGKSGGKGDGKVTVLQPGGQGGLVVARRGGGARRSASAKRPGSEGDGVGQGHDPRMLGAKTRLDQGGRAEQVEGVEGEGPSQSRVVRTAAQRGFATGGWRKVHQDYRQVVEDTMDRQQIPAGQRRYVRRYFDLIRPR